MMLWPKAHRMRRCGQGWPSCLISSRPFPSGRCTGWRRLWKKSAPKWTPLDMTYWRWAGRGWVQRWNDDRNRWWLKMSVPSPNADLCRTRVKVTLLCFFAVIYTLLVCFCSDLYFTGLFLQLFLLCWSVFSNYSYFAGLCDSSLFFAVIPTLLVCFWNCSYFAGLFLKLFLLCWSVFAVIYNLLVCFCHDP